MYGTANVTCIPTPGFVGLSIDGPDGQPQQVSQYLAQLGTVVLTSCTYASYQVAAVAGYYNEVWQDGQSASYYGGVAGSAGAAGAAGAAGTGGTGGTGETGTTGGEGAVFLITDSDDVPAGMMVGTYKTTIVNP
jgi:hypothetical protein